jgi:hypothetical protein
MLLALTNKDAHSTALRGFMDEHYVVLNGYATFYLDTQQSFKPRDGLSRCNIQP